MTTDPVSSPDPARRSSLAGRFKQPENLLTVVSGVLLPLGLMVIVLGWYGAAHTPYLFEQVPYLISGGLVGLALVLGGGLCSFGSWIARSAQLQRQSLAEVVALLGDIRAELASGPAAAEAVTVPTRPRRAAAGNGLGKGAAFVATSGGSMLHRPECSVVVGREDLHRVKLSSGLAPCGLCDPLSSTPTSHPETVHPTTVGP